MRPCLDQQTHVTRGGVLNIYEFSLFILSLYVLSLLFIHFDLVM